MARILKIDAWVICLVLLGMATSPEIVTAKEDNLPRYHLRPGEVLSYKGEVKFKYNNGAYLAELDTTAWVVRRNSDGSSRVILRSGDRFRSADSVESLDALIKKNDAAPMDFKVGYIDLFPNGSIGTDAEIGMDIDPAISFPRLPDKASESQWGQRDARTGNEYTYSSLQREPNGWKFNAERIGSEKTINGITFTSTYHFDRKKIVSVEQQFTQEVGIIGSGTGLYTLTGTKTMNAAAMTAFGKAADRFIAATRAYALSARGASRDLANCSTLMNEAKLKLISVRDSINDPIFREELNRKLANHDQRVQSCLQAAERRSKTIGLVSPNWSLQDLAGQTHSLSDYRGQIVVLDFWYRGCGWCVKSMPEMNALAERFKGQPVTILGMNIDAKEEDAKFVVEAMNLKYNTLRAVGIPEKYNLLGFPTVVIIGPDGVVRDIHAGYSSTLGTKLATSIDELLATLPQSTSKP